MLGEALPRPLAGLDELVDTSADAGFFLGRNSLRGEVVDAVIKASMIGTPPVVRYYFGGQTNKQPVRRRRWYVVLETRVGGGNKNL